MVDENVEKMSEAELPYLKGIEVCRSKKARSQSMSHRKRFKVTQEAIAKANSSIAAKSLESKSFAKDAASEVQTAFARRNTCITFAEQKVVAFKKDTAATKSVPSPGGWGDGHRCVG